MDLEIGKKKTRTQTKPSPAAHPVRPTLLSPSLRQPTLLTRSACHRVSRSQQAARFPDLTHLACVPSRAHNSALAAPSRGRAPAHALSPSNPGPACQPRSEHARQRRADTLAPALCNRPTLAHRSTPAQPTFAPVRLTGGPQLSAPISRKPRPRLSRCAPGPARQRHSRSAARPTDGPGPPASSVSPASPGRATARHDSRPGDLAGLPIRARTPRSPALPFLTPAAPLRRHPIPLAPHEP